MSVDQQVRDAGTRLAELPVEVPDLDALVRHRHRRRSAAMTGAIVLLLVVVVGSALVVRQPAERSPAGQGEVPADQGRDAAANRRPVTDEPIGLFAHESLWPADGRTHPTVEGVASQFASEVLGWDESVLLVEAHPHGGMVVTVSSGDRSVLVRAVAREDGWSLFSVGEGIGLGIDDGSTLITYGPRPLGTVAVQSWVLLDGVERVATHSDPTLRVMVDAPPTSIQSAVVVFLDAEGRALGASGGISPAMWREPDPDYTQLLPTYDVEVNDARLAGDSKGSPSVGDTAVWVSPDRQTYLTLTVRRGAGWIGPSYQGPLTEDTTVPADQGRAWFTTDEGEPVRSLEMWWSRPNGDLRIVSMHWPHAERALPYADARDQLRGWALTKLWADTFEGYTLGVVGSERLAIDEAGTIRHRARVWEHPAGEIVLSTWSDSVATGLTNALRSESVPIVVDDTKGWVSIDPNGSEPTEVAWQRDDLWFTLQVPHALADDLDVIIGTLERE